jgi:hypothetical protein
MVLAEMLEDDFAHYSARYQLPMQQVVRLATVLRLLNIDTYDFCDDTMDIYIAHYRSVDQIDKADLLWILKSSRQLGFDYLEALAMACRFVRNC